ncbi:hypothetical protein M0804_005345 [Polistes exclamans]|nr:hypothetical protein M0804_005345 [Polistes exclamans]
MNSQKANTNVILINPPGHDYRASYVAPFRYSNVYRPPPPPPPPPPPSPTPKLPSHATLVYFWIRTFRCTSYSHSIELN